MRHSAPTLTKRVAPGPAKRTSGHLAGSAFTDGQRPPLYRQVSVETVPDAVLPYGRRVATGAVIEGANGCCNWPVYFCCCDRFARISLVELPPGRRTASDIAPARLMARRAFPRWRVGVRMFAITEASFLSASAGVGSSQKDDLRCLRVCDAFPRCRTRSSASTHLTFVAHGSEPGRKPRRLSAKSADRSGPPCGQLERSQDAFQHRQRAHSTAQPSFQAPACFGHLSSLPLAR
jgi:hypothetical protein